MISEFPIKIAGHKKGDRSFNRSPHVMHMYPTNTVTLKD